jgi:hypothetical protein
MAISEIKSLPGASEFRGYLYCPVKSVPSFLWGHRRQTSRLTGFQSITSLLQSCGMISSLSWIPRGAAKLKPEYTEIAEDDEYALKAMNALAEEQVRLVHTSSVCMPL